MLKKCVYLVIALCVSSSAIAETEGEMADNFCRHFLPNLDGVKVKIAGERGGGDVDDFGVECIKNETVLASARVVERPQP